MIKAFLFSWLWLAGVIGASVLYRVSRGKPVLFFGMSGTSFQERTASGWSNRSFLTKLGGARSCLVVAVVGDRVVIRPWFPFTLMFLPEIYGLEYEFPVHDVVNARQRDSMFRKVVDLDFRNALGQQEAVSVLLRHPDQFLATLGQRASSAPVTGA
jgi:hypothetical protein